MSYRFAFWALAAVCMALCFFSYRLGRYMALKSVLSQQVERLPPPSTTVELEMLA